MIMIFVKIYTFALFVVVVNFAVEKECRKGVY